MSLLQPLQQGTQLPFTLFPPRTKTCCASIGDALARHPISPRTHIVLVNRGHGGDAEVLEASLHSEAAYIGMIGSRRKVSCLRDHFLSEGLATEEEWDRLYAPIGLDIGAVTVEEIATSVMAEIVSVRRKGRAAASASAGRPCAG